MTIEVGGTNCHLPSIARYFFRFTFAAMFPIHLLSDDRSREAAKLAATQRKDNELDSETI